jgi:hypothetical protein
MEDGLNVCQNLPTFYILFTIFVLEKFTFSMNKLLVIFFVLFLSFNINSQNRPSIENRAFSLFGIIASVKGGVTSGDKFLTDFSDYYTFDIPVGGAVEVTIEYPLGKFFYAGLNINGWYSRDKFTESETGSEINRKSFGMNFCPLIKYRYLIKKTAVSFSAGIGRSLVITKFSNSEYNTNIDMTNMCGNIGIEQFFGNRFFITGEASYYYLFGGYNARGDDRSNQMFLGKLGVGLVFPIKYRR